jgi:hypothetical protein
MRSRSYTKRAFDPIKNLAIATAALSVLDSTCSYSTWFDLGACIYTITEGSNDAFELFNAWSAESRQYPGRRRVEYQWQSIARYRGERRKGMPTLKRIVEEHGKKSWVWVLAEADDGSWADK